MKLRLFTALHSLSDFLIDDLQKTIRHVQWLRIWAWQHTTIENLRSINERQTRRIVL